jgi:outer membrane protein TolC
MSEAIQEALRGNAGLRVARANLEIADAEAQGAAAPLWPSLAVDAGFARSNDPVFVFGTKLRQGTFASADFDLAELNNPAPINDWSTGVELRWELLDATRWASRSAARHRAGAASWSTERSREETILRTEILYYGAQGSSAQLESAIAAEAAATAVRDIFSRRHDEGLITQAELLQAEAQLESARARRIDADRHAIDARQRLGMHLGWDVSMLPVPSDPLATAPLPAMGETDPGTRADLIALAEQASAAREERKSTSLSYLPSLGAFAGFRTHSAGFADFDANNWTLGVALRWKVFDGFGRSARHQVASAAEAIAETRYAQALREAAAEVDRAQRGVTSAARALEATRASENAAERARVLMQRRFEEGLATSSDVLLAEAQAVATRSQAIDALLQYDRAVAFLRFVRSRSHQESSR